MRHGVAFETLIDREPENERKPGREAGLELGRILRDVLLAHRRVLLCRLIAGTGGFWANFCST